MFLPGVPCSIGFHKEKSTGAFFRLWFQKGFKNDKITLGTTVTMMANFSNSCKSMENVPTSF